MKQKKNIVLQLVLSCIGSLTFSFCFSYILTHIIFVAGTEKGNAYTWLWRGEDGSGVVLCFAVQTLLLSSFCSSVFLVSYDLPPSVFSSLCSPLPLFLFSFFSSVCLSRLSPLPPVCLSFGFYSQRMHALW